MNNILSNYGLVDARISASEKDLPVQIVYHQVIFFNSAKFFWQKYEVVRTFGEIIVVITYVPTFKLPRKNKL